MAESIDYNLVQVECTENSRPMSPSEIIQFKLNQMELQHGLYTHVNLFNSSSSIWNENVKKSLHELAKFHYLLHAYVFKDDKGDYFFREMENTNVNSDWIQLQFLSADHTSEWVEIVNKDLQTKLDFEHGPLWRVIWVTCLTDVPDQFSYVLIFVCSHCIMDAKCCVDLFANQFLPILNGFVTGKEFQFEKKPIFLAKSYEEIFIHHGSQKMLSEYHVPWYVHYGVGCALWLFRTFSSSSRKPDMKVVEEKQNVVENCEFYPFDLNLEASLKVQSVCKDNLVSVHSVLLMVFAYSLKQLENKFECYHANFKSIIFPIDYRKFNKQLHTTPQPIGQYLAVSGADIKFIAPRDKNNFFDFCKNLTKIIKCDNKAGKPIKLFDAFVEIIRQNQLNTEMMDFFPTNVHLSNLGNCDVFVKTNPNDCVKLIGQYYCVGVTRNAVLLTISTLNKQMFFCIGYGACWFNKEFAEALSANIKDCLQNL